MLLSTNLPYGTNAIREHLASGEVLSMNVPCEADRAFMSELQRTDPARYARLAKAIMTDAMRRQSGKVPAPELAVPQSVVALDRKTPQTFKTCPGCDRRFLARRANNLTCSDRCRKRVTRTGPVSQITESTLSKAA